MKTVENPAQFMHDSGLLFEVNRKILHPLGLALFYTVNEDGTIPVQGLGVEQTGDGSPFEFAPERIAAAEARLAAFLAGKQAA